MQLLWSKKIYAQDPWEPKFKGVFSDKGPGIIFYYMDGGSIKSIYVHNGKSDVLFQEQEEVALPLPQHWTIVTQEETSYLLCGEQICIDLGKRAIVNPVPEKLRQAYRKQQVPPKHFEDDIFVFNEYQIEHKGEWGYSCKKNNKIIWSFSGKGYLHTDICRWHDYVYFGTAGYGGYFYILDINNGRPILSLCTGGTSVVKRCGSRCYLYTAGKRPQLLGVALSDGHIFDTVDLPGKVTDYSALGLCNHEIYAVSFEYKKGTLVNAILSCISY